MTAKSLELAQKFGAAAPLVGLDGRVVDVGGDSGLAGRESEARMNRQLSEWRDTSINEMSRLLAKLRADFDGLRLSNKQGQKAVTEATSEMARLEKVLAAEAERVKQVDADSERATAKDATAQAAKSCLEQEDRRSATLEHMILRLKRQRTDLETGIKNLQQELTLTKKQESEATVAVTMTRTEHKHAMALVTQLRRQLDADRTQRARKMGELDGVLADQGARRRAFDEREKRRLTIAHLPRGDLDEAGEDRLKQLFVVRRIYASMLARRLREDARRCDKLQAAFQRIRGVTGLADTREIVKKFLRRDEAVASLRSQLQGARDRLQTAKEARKVAAWRLDQVSAAAGGGSGRKRAQYVSREAASRRRADATRRCGERRQRVERLTVMLEDCRACVAKLLTRLGIPVVAEAARGAAEEDGAAGTGASTLVAASTIIASARAQSLSHAALPATAAGTGVAGARAMRRQSFGEGGGAEAAVGSAAPSSPVPTGAALGIAGAVGGLAASPSQAAHPGRAQSLRPHGEGEGVGPSRSEGAVRVTLQTLDSALGQVETAVSRALAQLAAAMERDEARGQRQPTRGHTGAAALPGEELEDSRGEEADPEAADPSNVRVSPRAPLPPRSTLAGVGGSSRGGLPPSGLRGSASGEAGALSAADLKRLQRMQASKDGGPASHPSASVPGLQASDGEGDEDDDEGEDLFTRHDIKRVSAMLVGQSSSAQSAMGMPEAARSRRGKPPKRSSKSGSKRHGGNTATEAAAAAAAGAEEPSGPPALGYVGPIPTPRPADKPSVIVRTDDARVRAAVKAGAMDARDAESQFVLGDSRHSGEEEAVRPTTTGSATSIPSQPSHSSLAGAAVPSRG